MPEFGDKFRKAREAKKLSLDDVSRVTKIGSRMLQAIEEEHFDVLPGGVFNRGFIRAYAKTLGLNDEEAVTDYLACLRQAQIEANQFREPEAARSAASSKSAEAPKANPPAKTPAAVEIAEELPDLQLPRAEHVRTSARSYGLRPESSLPITTLLIVAILIVTAAFFWMRHTRLVRTQAAVPAPTPTVAQPTLASPSTQQPQNAGVNVASPPSTSTATPSSQPATHAPSAPPASSTTPNPAPKPDSGNTIAAKTPPPASAPAKATDSEKEAAPLILVIRATENSWVSVTADGQLVSQETLIAPAETRIRATREVTVRVGNAAGVNFSWNGKEFPAQGAEAEAKTLVFDSEGIREATSQPAQNP